MYSLIGQSKQTFLVIAKALLHLFKGVLPFLAAAIILTVGIILWQKVVVLVFAENGSRKIGTWLMIFLTLLYTLFGLGVLLSLFLIMVDYPETMRD